MVTTAPLPSTSNPLLQRAYEEQIISEADVRRVEDEARTSGRLAEDLLWDLPGVDPQRLLQLKGRLNGTEVYVLEPGAMIPVEVLEIIPEDAVERYKVVPLKITETVAPENGTPERVLELGMINPNDVIAEEAVRFLARRRNLKIKKWLIGPKDLREILRQYRNLHEEVRKALGELEIELGGRPEVKGATPTEHLVEEAPLTKTVAVILKYATEGRASDIHIEPLEKQTRIRFRLDGTLHTSLYVPRDVHAGIVSRIKVLSDMKIDETRIPQDGRFQARMEDRPVDFRVSTFPSVFGEKVVMRILDSNVGLKRIEDLGLIGHNLEVIQRAMTKPFGMLLITGPTGSGKSTTLNGMLRILNGEGVNIVTLEDPVEYYVEGVSQSEVRPDIGYTFAVGLRHILRQDPDIIMVGEIRDLETALLGVHAALTGHLLLSSLHTNNAAGVIPRLIDMKIEPFLIPATLTVAVAQRLIKRLCPECKTEESLQKDARALVERILADLPKSEEERLKAITERKFYKPVGCTHCAMKGTKGRIAVYEALEMTPELEEITVREPNELTITKEAKRQGMVTMRQDGILKALEGWVSLQEVLEATE
ncbi:MAG: GspE/PulE family protein [bacterium]|nr:GspE/PulE family protein [bacterium]MDZ4296265.1 GspE/PulE family protein [Patescibacteria group bacterium]MDZ4296288.1 GspE/PulE family protein [Patescibacteria group bacterium]